MTTRTVRMTPEDEARLARIQRETGWSASDALKEGVRLLCEKLSNAPTSTAWDVYAELDVGEGGHAIGPASRSREAAREAIARKHKR